MAVTMKGAEKYFYLNTLMDHRVPVRFRFRRREYTLTLLNTQKGRLYLEADKPVRDLPCCYRMDLVFEYHGKVIQFVAEAESVIRNSVIVARDVDTFLKGLGRSFARVSPPADLQVAFAYQGERYDLDFPRLYAWEPVTEPRQFMADRGIEGSGDPIQELDSWAGEVADGYKAVFFTKEKPGTLEERLVAETGRVLYLVSPEAGLVKEDPYPERRMITGDLFLRTLERLGFDAGRVGGVLDSFIKAKGKAGIVSEAWVPIRFQEYVLGYISLWTVPGGKPPLDTKMVETAMEFSKYIAWALQAGGRFESRKIEGEPVDGTVLNISASGGLLGIPLSYSGLPLQPGAEVEATLTTPQRTIHVGVRIVWRFSSGSAGGIGLGCRFIDMSPEDLRFLFEYLYEKPFSEAEESLLAGHV
jgi:hypothetical protein